MDNAVRRCGIMYNGRWNAITGKAVKPSFYIIHFTLFIIHFLLPDCARAQGVGPGQQFYPVHDFRNDWLIYDPAFRTYIPYIDEQHSAVPAVSAYLELESNRHYYALVSTREDGYLFINAALRRKLPAGTWQVLSIDSLYRLYRTPEIFLTVYGGPGISGKLLFIGHRKPAQQKPVVLSDTGLSILPRRLSVFTNFFTVALLFVTACFAFLYNAFHRAFLRLFDVSDLFSVTPRDEPFLVNRPLSGTSLLFILTLSFVMALLYLFVQSKNIDVFASRSLLLEGQRFPDLLLSFFKLSAIAFALLIGKYVLIVAIGGLYRLEELTNIHFFKVLQSSMLFFTLSAAVIAVAAVNIPPGTPWQSNWLLLPFVGFYVGRLALLYLVLARRTTIKNLYLFSYLCIVELIPMIIGVRFAI